LKTIIYIISLGHSGSTLLDYLLSHNKSLISCGEIYNFYSQKPNTEGTKSKCSCGQPYSNCILWSNNFDQANFSSFYVSIVNKIEEIFPSALAVVDSSKKKCALEMLVKLNNQEKIDLKVVYLTKDVREFSASMKRHLSNKKKGYVPNFIRFFKWFRFWYKENLKIYFFLKTNEIDFLQITYQDLCKKSKESVDKIYEFANIDMKKVLFKISNNIHIADGNRTKYNLSKNFQVKYDDNWKNDYFCRIFYFVNLRIRRLNLKFQNSSLLAYKRKRRIAKDLSYS
tara:strand:- start:52 stop:900 length:849 start_codon:yes stop_codon:yes gene_type:complete